MPILYKIIRDTAVTAGAAGPADTAEEACEVTGYDGVVRALHIPPFLDGYPVRSIGPHAFDGRRDLTEVALPDSVRALRVFAFHGCLSLRRLILTDSIRDCYDGVIRHCPQLEEVRVRALSGDLSVCRALLTDSDRRMTFDIELPDGNVRLTFPGYAYEAREDTFARVIHFSIEGTGYSYRECVGRHALDLQTFDRLFVRAVSDDEAAAGMIALDRLMVPYRLGDAAAEQYRVYLRKNAKAVLARLIASANDGAVRFMAREGLVPEDARRQALRLAAGAGQTQICALLMEKRAADAEENNAADSAAEGSTEKEKTGNNAAAGRLELEDW